jgi:hypothetical protein
VADLRNRELDEQNQELQRQLDELRNNDRQTERSGQHNPRMRVEEEIPIQRSNIQHSRPVQHMNHPATSPFADMIMDVELVVVKKPIMNPYDREGDP